MAKDCVFCTRAGQPPRLFETRRLYVMPDKFPLVPGHTLVISKAHLPCFAAAAPKVLQELEETVAYVSRFLRWAYAADVQLWENGVAGQTVFHAHLHLIPAPVDPAPAGLVGHADVRAISGWDAIREYYHRSGSYRYAVLGGGRYLIAGHSPVMAELRRHWQRLLGLRWSGRDWVRSTTPEDVDDVARRWAAWPETGSRQ